MFQELILIFDAKVTKSHSLNVPQYPGEIKVSNELYLRGNRYKDSTHFKRERGKYPF